MCQWELCALLLLALNTKRAQYPLCMASFLLFSLGPWTMGRNKRPYYAPLPFSQARERSRRGCRQAGINKIYCFLTSAGSNAPHTQEFMKCENALEPATAASLPLHCYNVHKEISNQAASKYIDPAGCAHSGQLYTHTAGFLLLVRG